MSETQTYSGSCHCGAVKFNVTGNFDGGMTCNCSICRRAGYVLAFVPSVKFELLSGQDTLTDYQFGKKHLHHPFCARCGVRVFSYGTGPDGSEMHAVNLRCLENFDLGSIKVQEFDGKNIPLD